MAQTVSVIITAEERARMAAIVGSGTRPLNMLDGAVRGRCMHKQTHQEFIRFLNAVEGSVPAGKLIPAILDNLRDR
jgi:hypothetical protein